MPQRLAALEAWLRDSLGLSAFTLSPASADASFRRYFRVHLPDGPSRIAMDAPPEQESCGPFVDVARRLGAAGVHVPQVLAEDHHQGFLLLSDLGQSTYLQQLEEAHVDRLYGDALGALASMQACATTEGLPHYDAALLRREMDLFRDWLLGQKLGIVLRDADQDELQRSWQVLIDNALAQPQVFVHRDYHSRNLMRLPSANPGVLDFQDAVLGPITYDLVSLLRDCYIRWPRSRVEEWAQGYRDLALHSGILREQQADDFMRWFDLMGVQRHLKAAGIFARLDLRDGKPGYLPDIPRTLGYITEVAAGYPELGWLGELVEQRVLPASRQWLAETERGPGGNHACG